MDTLADLSGYRCVFLGPAYEPGSGTAATLCQWRGDVRPGPGVDFVHDAVRLPLASHSVDVLILQHALEHSADPHALVSEATRVLSERGQIVCLVFDPTSAWALWQWWRPASSRFRPGAVVPPAPGRLATWLTAAEFTAMPYRRYGAGFVCRASWAEPRAWFAGGYLLVAKRRGLRRAPEAKRGERAVRGRSGLAPAAGSGLPCPR